MPGESSSAFSWGAVLFYAPDGAFSPVFVAGENVSVACSDEGKERAGPGALRPGLLWKVLLEKDAYFVPKMRSPASPRPGRM